MPLTEKQATFVREYLVDLNATQAAIRAGYSRHTAEQQGCRLLRNAQVKAAVEEAMAARAGRTDVTADRVLRELAAVAFANMGDFIAVGANGEVALDFSGLSEADLRAVTKLTQKHIPTKGGPNVVETKFELGAKVQALTKLGEHLGMFKVPVEHDVSDTLAALLREIDGKTRGLPTDE